MYCKEIMIVLLLVSVVIISGCTERYVGYCLKDDVIGVYNCQGGELKIEYSVDGKGFEVVNSDGTVVECPAVALEYLSDECKAVLEEDYCETNNLCLPEETTTTT